jgi:hypothetical protein
MGQENFHASVQYNDFKGTAAADRHDMTDIGSYLDSLGLLKEGEFLIGVEVYARELMGHAQVTHVDMTALVTRCEGFDDVQTAVDSGTPLQVRKIRVEIPLVEFFTLFKRFQISLSVNGMIDNRDIAVDA